MTKTPPITARAIGLPRSKPDTAKVAPRERAPTSPSQILAGQILKYKKAMSEPINNPMNDERVVSSIERDIIKKAIKEMTNKPAASPSSPSDMFTALANETITKAAKGT